MDEESLHHKRSLRNTLSVSVNCDILLLGIGVYTGSDEDLFDESLTITFDRTTHKIILYR